MAQARGQTFINYGRNTFCNICPRGLYYKTLRIRNLQELGDFVCRRVKFYVDAFVPSLESLSIGLSRSVSCECCG
jgi:hypothetical protein